MKTWIATLLAAAIALPAAAQQSQREKWNAPGEAFQIIGNAYYVGTAGLASYLFKTNDGLILLDGALPESAPMIEANIVKLGFKVLDIKILLNSHGHFDHTGGLAQLKKDSGAKLYVMEGDVSAVEGGFFATRSPTWLAPCCPARLRHCPHPHRCSDSPTCRSVR